MINESITNINPYALVITIVLGIVMFYVPRRFAAIPVMIIATYITLGQVINIASCNFTLFRLIVLFGWVRLILRGEVLRITFNEIDKTLLTWVTVTFIAHNILWQTTGALINQLGFVYDTVGLYFLFRILIHDFDDVAIIVRSLSVIIIPLAMAMILEHVTERNIFAFLGSVEEITLMRDDTLRAQGTFNHPILAGTFGASLMAPFIAYLFTMRRDHFLILCGIIAAATITLASGSIGPLITCLCGVVGMAAWFCRRHLRQIVCGLALGLVGLQLMIKEPIWHIVDQLGELTGGTGEHRSELIDQAILHFNEWWLYGTTYTAHWMERALEEFPDKADITNMYIAVGVNGGVISLILFITFFILSFRAIGKMVKQMEEQGNPWRYLVWSLGVALFAHAVSFMSVAYFDQITLFLYLVFAMISSIYNSYDNKRVAAKVVILQSCPPRRFNYIGN